MRGAAIQTHNFNMEKQKIPSNEFRLGVTMAGAASAGCYTGGAMDYLFQLLDSWEKAKRGELPAYESVQHLIPNHSVVIDAFGGTSAGGMTSTMSAIYGLNGDIKPVLHPGEAKERKGNLFYDSWVVMEDMDKNDSRDTFEKLFDTDDLEDGKVNSILNSKFIDSIADRSFDYQKDLPTQVRALPSYISPQLQLLLSHCLLRGIPLDVNFETAVSKKGRTSVIPNHTTYEHYLVSQYHLNNGYPTDPDKYIWLNPYDQASADILKLSTKATGAFPAGLLFREFTPDHFNKNYLTTVMKRIVLGELGNDHPDPENRINLKYLDKHFSSLTVDGGAINNEPYREVMCLLKNKYQTGEAGYPQFGVIMIDPFPDQGQFEPDYEKPSDLLDVVPAILGALTDQARVKRRELLETEGDDSFRSIIFPRKWTINHPPGKAPYPTPNKNPIASSAAMAFGGLLDIDFRQHDFFLGRNNARNFFRYWFSFPYDEANNIIHPIHRGWTKEMREAFAFSAGKKPGLYLPIIPDIQQLIEPKPADVFARFHYDVPAFPKYDAHRLFKLKPVMNKRFLKMIDLVKHRDKAEVLERPLAKLWQEYYAKKGPWATFTNWLLQSVKNLAFKAARKPVAGMMADAAIDMILKDLEKTGCLRAIKNEPIKNGS